MSKPEISALVDDEVTNSERRLVIDTLCTDGAARRAWGRYHMIGTVVRENAENGTRAGRVAMGLAKQKHGLAFRTLSLVSVAVFCVLLVGVWQTTKQEATVADKPAGGVPMRSLAVRSEQPLTLESQAMLRGREPAVAPRLRGTARPDPRLNEYLVNFNQQRSRLSAPGVNPYVRIVGFEPE